jgi:acetyl esterase/lipase
VLKLIRPSRIAAIVLIFAVPMALANWRAVFLHTVSAPSYIGFYERHADIRYGDLPRQSLDVYSPSDGASSRPTVVFWHGGHWKWGSKEQYRFVGAALANSGYVAILPNYRLFPQVRFPQFIDDGALAVRWAREHVRELGGDPREIFLMGHSAGGHLAATLALDEQYLAKVGGDSSWIRGWIALSAPYEWKWTLPQYDAIFGERPITEWRPIAHVSERSPPALLMHGLEDPKLHPREAVHMGEKLRAAGVPVECRIYASAGHMAPVLALSPLLRFQASTLADLREFVDRTVDAGAMSEPDFSDPCPSVRGRKSWDRPRPQPMLREVP